MKVCVFGAGAVGGYVAGRLASRRPEIRLSVVGRGPHIDSIRRDGLLLRHADGSPEVGARVQFAGSGVDAPDDHDVVIVTLKTTGLEAAAEEIGRAMAPGGVAVYVNNGIPWWWHFHGSENSRQFQSVQRTWQCIGPERVLGCVAVSSNSVTKPGVVLHHGGNDWVLGEPTGVMSTRLTAVVELLQSAGLQSRASADLRAEIWRKLLINVPNHALASLTRLSTDVLYADSALVDLALCLVREVKAIASANGCDLASENAANVLRRLTPLTLGARPSMLQDVQAGRRLEVEVVFDRLIELGALASVETPLLVVVARLLHGLDRSMAATAAPATLPIS